MKRLPRCSVVLAASVLVAKAGDVQFNRDIRPILSDNCFACHGPDSASRKAGMRFDREEGLFGEREGGPAVVKSSLEKSLLYRRIMSNDPDEIMPPPKSHKTLTDAQKEKLKRWIEQGAPWEKHWSFLPPTRPTPPAVQDQGWVRNPIDRFILARLEKEGLAPAVEADRRTLARRVSLDLTGLPPEPSEVEAFVNDSAPSAYEDFVDRLLKSKRWGEHRARYWLDLARYGDTHGIHFDNYREIWAYRDWVIDAFNRNLPYDQFTIEQLAGDLLPNRTLDQQIASGFNRCNITTNEGGAIDEEYLVLYTRDRTETTSQVWMGLTAQCAVCHDHKLDPISQREFYQLAAFFNNTTQAAMDGNIKDTPPTIVAPRREDRERHSQLVKELAEWKAKTEARRKEARGDFQAWRKDAKPEAFASQTPTDGLRLHAKLDEENPSAIAALVDGKATTISFGHPVANHPGRLSDHAFNLEGDQFADFPSAGDFERDQAFTAAAWLRLTKEDKDGSVMARMKDGADARGWDMWMEQGQLGAHLVHHWPDNAIKVVSRRRLELDRWHHVCLTYDGSSKKDGLKIYVDGEEQALSVTADSLRDTMRTETPFRLGSRKGGSRLMGAGVQDLRLYDRRLSAEEVGRVAKNPLIARLLAQGAEADELFQWWLVNQDAPYAELAKKTAGLIAEKQEIEARGTVAHVMSEKSAEPMAHVLYRGDYDKRRDAVKVGTPAVLPPFPNDLPKNRLGLAKWLVREDHPLTARVAVNRFWQEVFGTGLVKSSGDFGIAGEPPSHPELLDWLAVEFRETGWDIRRLFKLMVTSAAYRQAAVTTPQKREKDPENRLLSRGPRFRMDAEMVRDSALAVSGLLSSKIGGPSARPYQPPGVWEAVAMIGSDTRDYRQDQGENLYRRSMYTIWKRSAPPASMEIFNAPSREHCTVRRERTNTPLQALVTLNDPQFVEAARRLAETALKRSADTDERLRWIGLRLLSRPWKDAEMALLRTSADDLLAHYREHPKDAQALIAVGASKPDAKLPTTELAAWTMAINQMMNLDEALNK